jgi:hypothetical protein
MARWPVRLLTLTGQFANKNLVPKTSEVWLALI